MKCRIALGLALTLVVSLACSSAASASIYWVSQGSLARANDDGSGITENLFQFPNGACGLAVYGPHVYWRNQTEIGRTDLDGGHVNPDVVDHVGSGCGLAVGPSGIYWTRPDGVGRANLDGSHLNRHFIFKTESADIHGIGVDSHYLYWANLMEFGDNNGDYTSAVSRSLLNGTHVQTNFWQWGAIPEPHGVTIAGSNLFAVDGGSSFSVQRADVRFMPAGGGSASSFPAGGDACGSVAGDDRFVYWGISQSAQDEHSTPNGPPAIGRASSDGQNVNPSFIADLPTAPCPLAVAQPLGPPSNEFTFGRVRKDRRHGTATIRTSVPGPGSLLLRGPGVASQRKRVGGAGPKLLRIAPRGPLAFVLEKTGSVLARIEVRYRPHGGTASTEFEFVGLRKRRGH